jgi:hypothetical protein
MSTGYVRSPPPVVHSNREKNERNGMTDESGGVNVGALPGHLPPGELTADLGSLLARRSDHHTFLGFTSRDGLKADPSPHWERPQHAAFI